MKKRTIALAIGLAVILTLGCGGGGSGNDTGAKQDDSGNSGIGSGSQTLKNLISQVDAQTNLDGHTVKVSDPKNTSALFKEQYFVFTPGNKVKFVENKDNGDQFVHDGTYVVKTYPGFGNVIEVSYNNNGTDASTMIFLDDTYHVKTKQLGNDFPAEVFDNDKNGLVIKDNQPATGTNALTVNSPEDVRGYTITSNEASHSVAGITYTQIIKVTFACDGSFVETITTGDQTSTDTGNDIQVDGDELSWTGANSGDSIFLDSNHQIVEGRNCYMSGGTGTGEECANNLYVKTITKDTTCQ